MSHNIIDTSDDIQWLKETHLKGVILPTKWVDFKFAILQGNEDSPYALNLYVSQNPDIDDDYLRVVFTNEPPVYCEYCEYSGKTDKPKRFYP